MITAKHCVNAKYKLSKEESSATSWAPIFFILYALCKGKKKGFPSLITCTSRRWKERGEKFTYLEFLRPRRHFRNEDWLELRNLVKNNEGRRNKHLYFQGQASFTLHSVLFSGHIIRILRNDVTEIFATGKYVPFVSYLTVSAYLTYPSGRRAGSGG